MEGFLKSGENLREEKWTSSIAVGSEGFVGDIKALMSSMASGRRPMGAGESFQLRETQSPYSDLFGTEKGEIEPINAFIWK